MSERPPRVRTIDIGAPRGTGTHKVLGPAVRRLVVLLRALGERFLAFLTSENSR